jgi:hypothetical protein
MEGEAQVFESCFVNERWMGIAWQRIEWRTRRGGEEDEGYVDNIKERERERESRHGAEMKG